MSKDYICKDCIHNNYGWCKALKRNKLKEIDKCAIKDNGSKPKKLRPFEELKNYEEPQAPQEIKPLIMPKKEDKVIDDAYRVLGKREMLWNIQRQAIAIKNDNTIPNESKFEMLCHSLNSICQMQEYSEKIYNIEDIIDSEIDEMMIIDSKKIDKVL